LGFPCNQFGGQEPGTDAEIAAFVADRFGISGASFPMFSKIEVNGDGACELFRRLSTALPKDDGDGAIAWNFTKFLVGADGTPQRRFEPRTTPEEIRPFIEELLGEALPA